MKPRKKAPPTITGAVDAFLAGDLSIAADQFVAAAKLKKEEMPPLPKAGAGRGGKGRRT